MTGFRRDPSFNVATPGQLIGSAYDAPMALGDTLIDQMAGGLFDSYGLGTAIRTLSLPSEAPTQHGLMLQPSEGGAPVILPDTPQMRRRATMLGAGDNIRPETADELQARRAKVSALSQDEYIASPYYRTNIPYDPGMTVDRAAALASWDDAKKVRQFYAEKRPIAAFVGNFVGQAADPINYVPVAGPLVKAAAVGRFGRIAGESLAGALDAAGNTALFGLATSGVRAGLGDDVSWQTMTTDIAMSALIGSAFGAIGGAVGARTDARLQREQAQRLSTLKNTQEARIALNEAIDGLVNTGEVNLSRNAIDPIQAAIDRLNPAKSPDMFARLEQPDVFSTTAVGRFIDTRPMPVQDFEGMLRNKVFSDNADLAARYTDAESKFNNAQDATAAIEEPLAARRESDAVALVDAASADRLRAIETDLAAQPDARRRAALEAERQTIVETLGPDVIAKAENDFRIGPEKRAKAARKSLAAARQEFSRVRREVDAIASQKLAEDRVRFDVTIDTSKPRPDPIPDGRPAAEMAIGVPDHYKAMAEQHRVDPETGSFIEEAEIRQLDTEGRLTADDRADLDAAQKVFDDGSAFGEALKAAVTCLI